MFTYLSIIILLFVNLVILFLKIHSRKKKLYEFSKLNGGPRPYPILGNITVLFKKDILEGICKLKQLYSLPCNFWLWGDYYYITDCPHETKKLLTNTKTSFQKAPFYDDLIRVLLGNSFIMYRTNEVQQWKLERKLLAKSFHPSMWETYTPVFHKKITNILQKLEEIHDTEKLIQILNRNAFEIFLENFLGIEMKSHLEEQELLSAFTQTMDLLADRSTIKRFMPKWFYKNFTEEGKTFYALLRTVRKIMMKLINEKRGVIIGKNDTNDKNTKPLMIESLLLEENIKLDDEDILQQLFVIYFTSMDTSVLSLAYLLMQLGMHPEIQENVYGEIQRVIGKDKEIVPKDLNHFKYLEQCINETLRLYPIVPFVGRHITEDVQLGSKILPKDANVIISPYLVHRNEKYWHSPEVFDPSRFSPENASNIVIGSYIPFLMGPRDCLGRYYSTAQLKVMVANILREYKVHVDPKAGKCMKLKSYIVIKPQVNIDIDFVKRSDTA